MPVTSAALCLWRHNRGSGAPADDGLEVLLVHPGGPFWASKDEHAWSFPKGEFNPETEDALDAAKREFAEELGVVPPEGDYVDLDEVIQKGGKVVRAWAIAGDVDTSNITSNTFEVEWPPRSGKRQKFPEVDRAEWCSRELAEHRLNPAQVDFVARIFDIHSGRADD